MHRQNLHSHFNACRGQESAPIITDIHVHRHTQTNAHIFHCRWLNLCNGCALQFHCGIYSKCTLCVCVFFFCCPCFSHNINTQWVLLFCVHCATSFPLHTYIFAKMFVNAFTILTISHILLHTSRFVPLRLNAWNNTSIFYKCTIKEKWIAERVVLAEQRK